MRNGEADDDGGDATGLLTIRAVTCPYCWEETELVLDLSAGSQRYVEDCSVCCRPMVVAYRVDDGALGEVSARTDTE